MMPKDSFNFIVYITIGNQRDEAMCLVLNRLVSVKKIKSEDTHSLIDYCGKSPLMVFCDCDYKCDSNKCWEKLYILSKYKDIPFVILRPSLKDRTGNKEYYFTFYERNKETRLSGELIDKLKESNIYALSPYRFIHPSNTLSKILFLQEQIAEKINGRMKLSEIAKSVKVSQSWLSHKFYDITNIALNDYHKRNIFCNALWKVVSTDLSIKQIAIEYGYRPHSFTNRFHKLFKTLPTDIRTGVLNL
jgi:AraC-like DNA-binding protein